METVNRTIDVGGTLATLERSGSGKELTLRTKNRIDEVNITLERSWDNPHWLDITLSIQYPDKPSGDDVEVFGVVQLDREDLETLRSFLNDLA